MYKHNIKTFHYVQIGMLRHNVKDLLGVIDTKLVKKWAVLAWDGEVGHAAQILLAIGTRRSVCMD
ncbi:hypothetical protein [Iningainema tapete]|uniref:hypothetical protein n=1 Tax=Iningainema tapete TaxID=2806730 RepID=UPI0030D893B9